MSKIIFIDNFDSFTYNLVDLLRSIGHDVIIYRNNFKLKKLIDICLNENCILAISPGPGHPAQAGGLLKLIKKLKDSVPILGICLGHQAIANAFGHRVLKAKDILHGKVSYIKHDGQAMFTGLPNPMRVARYHSLVATRSIEKDFVINAEFGDYIMAIRHKTLPICGFQFHPESILTVDGVTLLDNTIQWLEEHRIAPKF